MTVIETIRAEVSSIEDKRNNMIAEYTEKLETAKAREAEALEAADAAYRKAKVADYHKAQEEIRINHDAAEMYTNKIAELQKEPMITKKDFEALHKDITEYLAGIVAEDKESLRELVKQMLELKNRDSAAITEGNELLEHIQRHLLKDPCGIYTKNGNFIDQPYTVKRFKDYSVCEFLDFVTKHPIVEDLVPKEKPVIWGRG